MESDDDVEEFLYDMSFAILNMYHAIWIVRLGMVTEYRPVEVNGGWKFRGGIMLALTTLHLKKWGHVEDSLLQRGHGFEAGKVIMPVCISKKLGFIRSWTMNFLIVHGTGAVKKVLSG